MRDVDHALVLNLEGAARERRTQTFKLVLGTRAM
jgi:hypothetical protein